MPFRCPFALKLVNFGLILTVPGEIFISPKNSRLFGPPPFLSCSGDTLIIISIYIFIYYYIYMYIYKSVPPRGRLTPTVRSGIMSFVQDYERSRRPLNPCGSTTYGRSVALPWRVSACADPQIRSDFSRYSQILSDSLRTVTE